MAQNEKALILAFLSLNRRCPKSARNTLLKGKVPPDPTIFIMFLWEILPNAPEPHYFFIIFIRKYCPGSLPQTTLYLVETVPDPTIFYFSR